MNENLDPNIERLSNTDKESEKVLRPQEFEDFTGQHKILENLKIFVMKWVLGLKSRADLF